MEIWIFPEIFGGFEYGKQLFFAWKLADLKKDIVIHVIDMSSKLQDISEVLQLQNSASTPIIIFLVAKDLR